jgi:hypothetical protein
MREKLINAIIEYAGDELSEYDYADIARESEEELVDRLIYVLEYYFNEYNNG